MAAAMPVTNFGDGAYDPPTPGNSSVDSSPSTTRGVKRPRKIRKSTTTSYEEEFVDDFTTEDFQSMMAAEAFACQNVSFCLFLVCFYILFF